MIYCSEYLVKANGGMNWGKCFLYIMDHTTCCTECLIGSPNVQFKFKKLRWSDWGHNTVGEESTLVPMPFSPIKMPSPN